MAKRHHSHLYLAACAAFTTFLAAPIAAHAQSADSTSAATGSGATATNDSVANGYNATASNFSVANGYMSTASNHSVAEGSGAMATGAGGAGNIAIGTSSAANTTGSGTDGNIAIGNNATASNSSANGPNIAIGSNSTASSGSVATGQSASATGTNSVAVGQSSSVSASANYGVAIGRNAGVTGTFGTALGAYSSAGSGDTALGYSAMATGSNSVAIGTGSTDGGQANVVSFGNSGMTRRLINVAPGQSGTDAVNMNQLNGVVSALGSGSFTATGAWVPSIFTVPTTTGSTTYSTVSAALAGIGARVTSLETTVAGFSSSSTSPSSGGSSTSSGSTTNNNGVTNDQLAAAASGATQNANSYTDQQIGQLSNTLNQDMAQMGRAINDLSNRVDGVGAMSAAASSNMFNPYDSHDTQLGVGVATYRGSFGYSVGMFHRFSPSTVANLKVSGATQAAGVAVGGGVTMGVNLF
jgi:hypothetical protein